MKIENIDEINVKQWCQRLNIIYDAKIVPYYKRGIALYNTKNLFAVDKKRLTNYNRKFNIFRKWFDEVLLACDDIAQNEDLLIYVYAFIEILGDKEDINILKAPDLNCRATDFAPLFSFMYFLDDMISEMQVRGCSHQIISDTLNGFDSEMTDHYNIYGRSGMRPYVGWFMLFINNRILRIGRMQFEIRKLQYNIRAYEKDGDVKILVDGEYMHPKGMVFGSAKQNNEDEKYFAEIVEDGENVTGYAANEFGECIPQLVTLVGYKELLRKGDHVLSVHVPSDGRLDYDSCEKSYKEAEFFFKKAYPEYNFKSFTCFSWLMDKRLKAVIGKETNITKFADDYFACPLLSQGEGIYFSLFNKNSVVSADELPENTSLQKKVKNYLADGNVLYVKGGVRLFKYINN